MAPLPHLGEPGGPFDPWAWFNIVGEVGCALWVVAYGLIIRQCFRDKSYGLPLGAICLNVSWEFLACAKGRRRGGAGPRRRLHPTSRVIRMAWPCGHMRAHAGTVPAD